MFLSGCTSPVASISTSTPVPPPSFRGRLLVGHDEGIFALISNSDTNSIQELQIAEFSSSERDKAISPDNHYLLVSSYEQNRTLLIDLLTLESTTVLSHIVDCPQWAIDSKRFSYIDPNEHSLHIYNMDTGNSKLIFQAPSATYGLGTVYAGDLDCGFWISDDHLLFQRFSGEIPGQVTIPGAPELNANSTTLAILGGQIRLIDFPELLFVLDVSKDQSYILLKNLHGDTFLVKSFKDFTEMRLHALPSSLQRGFAQFMPNSNEVIVWHDRNIYSVNVETLESIKNCYVPFNYFDDGWMGYPNDEIVIGTTQYNIEIRDCNTGVDAALWPISKYGTIRWLAWIP
jgi:hypothetical protein